MKIQEPLAFVGSIFCCECQFEFIALMNIQCGERWSLSFPKYCNILCYKLMMKLPKSTLEWISESSRDKLIFYEREQFFLWNIHLLIKEMPKGHSTRSTWAKMHSTLISLWENFFLQRFCKMCHILLKHYMFSLILMESFLYLEHATYPLAKPTTSVLTK